MSLAKRRLDDALAERYPEPPEDWPLNGYVVIKDFECMKMGTDCPGGIDVGFREGERIYGRIVNVCGNPPMLDIENATHKVCGIPADHVILGDDYEKLKAIAKKELRFETLETRRSDSLDFRDVSVWAVREALQRAYLEGLARGEKNATLDPEKS